MIETGLENVASLEIELIDMDWSIVLYGVEETCWDEDDVVCIEITGVTVTDVNRDCTDDNPEA